MKSKQPSLLFWTSRRKKKKASLHWISQTSCYDHKNPIIQEQRWRRRSALNRCSLTHVHDHQAEASYIESSPLLFTYNKWDMACMCHSDYHIHTHTHPFSLSVSVISRLQHALTQGQVPVVLRAVFLKVFSCHVLRGALFELHVTKAALLRRALWRGETRDVRQCLIRLASKDDMQ